VVLSTQYQSGVGSDLTSYVRPWFVVLMKGFLLADSRSGGDVGFTTKGS
jgi:hypothetical protein